MKLIKGDSFEEVKKLEKTYNTHPTVKPIKLMKYLCEITKTPTGGTVLDPFMGSGSTGIACIKTGRKFIGIEREEKYFEIANARLKYHKNRGRQVSLFENFKS